MIRTACLFLAVLGMTAPAMAKVRLVEAGIICPEIRDGDGRREAPETETGFIDIIDQDLVFDLPDRHVPLIQHLSFGFRVALKPGEPNTRITIVVDHPPTGDAGITRESWSQWIAGGERSMNLFTFDYAYEMVPGPWTFAIEVAGQRQVEVPFVVGPPGFNPKVDQVCLGALNS